ncbi:hypothetical protein RvY_11536 [Ramazzottius varieornatus]|uniref:BED-type domain-containing protein n=1 Tax=Ramazzottius varieornatus TaxID=947166 RepID=A0A1D1VGH9_RAMVA|nr:hypothetical protein RvY_11536 [Ramazzottius varieornatus]
MSDNEENDGGSDTERDKTGDSKPGRLDVWAEFERSSKYWLNSKLRQATCKHCVEAGVKNVKPIRGDKPRMEQHLKKCVHVPRTVREKQFPVTVKRASATETSTELATKRVRSQSSLLGFVDRPLTKDKQKQFEELYGDACVSCNIPFSAADDARMERLLKFLVLVWSFPADSQVLAALCQHASSFGKVQFRETLRQSDVVSNWFRKSSLSQGKLRDLQFEFYSKEISMPGWTQTRWYSIHVSVQRVLDSKSALQMYGVRYGTNLGLVPFELKVVLDDDDFWAGAREIAVVLKPLVEAQREAESDNCTIADMGAAVRNIYRPGHFVDADVSVGKAMEELLSDRRCCCAMFLHPKYKLNLFRSDPAKVHSGVIYKWTSDLYRQFFRKDPTKLLTSAIHYSGSKNIFDAKYTRQLSNPFDYWSYAEAEHAELAQLAKFLLSACPHAAAVERFWKKMKEVHTANRNRLQLSLVSGMCTLKMKLCREDNVREAEKQKKTEKKAGEGETTSHCGVPTIEIEGGAIADQGSRSGDLMRLESQTSELDELFAQDKEAAEEDGDGDQPALSGEKFFTLAELFNTSGV